MTSPDRPTPVDGFALQHSKKQKKIVHIIVDANSIKPVHNCQTLVLPITSGS